MIVAEIVMLAAPRGGLLTTAHGQHNIYFDCLETANAEYQRVVGLLKRRDEKANDLPIMLEVAGAGNKVSFPLADLCSVALSDYEHANRQRSGVKEAFPHLFPG